MKNRSSQCVKNSLARVSNSGFSNSGSVGVEDVDEDEYYEADGGEFVVTVGPPLVGGENGCGHCWIIGIDFWRVNVER
ncbi:hypothetical protein L1987_63548 [Smallanthus sonchifolius]|uniref:Uncharacterized protein n=1 Tax=Smallanthus sonchifolius TaxID=185202 RepID=A0ACB9CDJ0_9ASTR|nr:hypothetical protein L1987_63548 [Smallanthus sonchifolius]